MGRENRLFGARDQVREPMFRLRLHRLRGLRRRNRQTHWKIRPRYKVAAIRRHPANPDKLRGLARKRLRDHADAPSRSRSLHRTRAPLSPRPAFHENAGSVCICSIPSGISGISCVPRWSMVTANPRSRRPFTRKGPLGPVPPITSAFFTTYSSFALLLSRGFGRPHAKIKPIAATDPPPSDGSQRNRTKGAGGPHRIPAERSHRWSPGID